MTTPPEPRCDGCRFWTAITCPEYHGQGWCNRFPPVPLCINPGCPPVSEYPITDPDDWCGEFSPRPSAALASPPPAATSTPSLPSADAQPPPP